MGCCGGFVGDVWDATGGAVVDAVGDIVEDVVDVVEDAGRWLDDNIIQPALDDPLRTIATVAAIATQQYYLIPVINATSTALQGGDLLDIAKSYAVSELAVTAGGQVGGNVNAGTGVAGATGSQAAGNIAAGAASGGTSAALSGGDIEKGIISGGVTSAVGQGVRAASSQVSDYTSTQGQGPNITTTSPTTTLTTAAPVSTTSGIGITEGGYTGLQTDISPVGISTPTAPAITPTAVYSDYGSEFGLGGPITDFSVGATGGRVGIDQFAQPVGVSTGDVPNTGYGTLTTPTQPGGFQKAAEKIATKAITKSVLGTPSTTRTSTANVPPAFDYESLWDKDKPSATDATGTAKLALAPSTYSSVKYRDALGNIIMIPHKDGQPSVPIPAGAVLAAKGGLIDTGKASVVKSVSNKRIAGKGLAIKKV